MFKWHFSILIVYKKVVKILCILHIIMINIHNGYRPYIAYLCPPVYARSCLTLCSSIDYSPLGSSVHGIFQARILEWVAISCFKGSFRHSDRTCVSCIFHIASRLFTTEPPGKPKLIPNLVIYTLYSISQVSDSKPSLCLLSQIRLNMWP